MAKVRHQDGVIAGSCEKREKHTQQQKEDHTTPLNVLLDALQGVKKKYGVYKMIIQKNFFYTRSFEQSLFWL